MKTLEYNPSYLEIVIAETIAAMQKQIDEKLHGMMVITDVYAELKLDNPRIRFTLEDSDGDIHKVVIQVTQTIDND